MHRSLPLVLLFLVMPAGTRAQAVPATAAGAGLEREVTAILERAGLERAHWGVHAVDAATGAVIYSRNADRLFVPASNLKLVVAAAGAHYLGPDYVWQTTLHAAGALADGELRGNLVVRGNGDPGISGRFADGMLDVLESWADSLAERGIRRITGDIIADQTLWDSQLRSPDWELYDVNWWYAAPVAPLGFNDNAIDFRVRPGAVGQPARITWQPAEAELVLINGTRTVPAGGDYTLDFDRVAGTDTIFAFGEIPAGAAARDEHFAVADPGRYLATVLRTILQASGISVGGNARSVYAAPSDVASAAALFGLPAAARRESAPGGTVAEGAIGTGTPPLFTWRSKPLPETVAPILLTSQNWFAEQLLKTIGLEARGEGSFQAGLAAETEFLTRIVGIDSAAFVLRDASGLSASNLITPRALVRLVDHIHDSDLRDVLEPGISVSGESGSLRNRLTDLSGRVAAKTGSIRHVNSLSGVVRAQGRDIVFAILANNTGLSGTRVAAAIDDLVRLLARQ